MTVHWDVARKRAGYLWILVLLASVSCSRVYIGHPPVAVEPPMEAEAVVYVLGDMGLDNESFQQIVSSLKKDVEHDRVEPRLLAVGDNLYEAGLPSCSEEASSKGREAIQRLRFMAQLLSAIEFQGRPVRLMLVPGNHDYAGNALETRRRLGDITRWYFPGELGIPGAERWTMLPGDPSSVGAQDSVELHRKLYQSGDVPNKLAGFMKPQSVTLGHDVLTLAAIDSELLLELYAEHPAIAEEYLAQLERALAQADGAWRLVAAHHPIATGGAHRPGLPQRFLLGPGWPQYPALWHKVFIWAGPAITFGRWAFHSRQDIHNGAYEKYRARLYQTLRDTGADLMIAGHDHNTQLIELSELSKDRPGPDGKGPFQLLTGEVAKVDPVAKQKGTLFYHADGGYVRVAANRDRVHLQVKNGSGEMIEEYEIRKR